MATPSLWAAIPALLASRALAFSPGAAVVPRTVPRPGVAGVASVGSAATALRRGPEEEASGVAYGATLALAGALAFGAAAGSCRRRSNERGSLLARKYGIKQKTFESLPKRTDEIEGATANGPSYKTFRKLIRQSSKGQKYHKQHRILADAGITMAKGGFHVWYPDRDLFNLYNGPESHPNNPYFPAMSHGTDRSELGPHPQTGAPRSPLLVRAGLHPNDGVTTVPENLSYRPQIPTTPGRGGFKVGTLRLKREPLQAVGSGLAGLPVSGGFLAAGRFVPTRGARRGLVICHAHKKAASSTKNQGHSSNCKHWGLNRKAYQGNSVKTGDLLVRQKGTVWHPGANVVQGNNFNLHAKKDGIVQWRGDYKHKEIFVVPWQYVREKCTWINPNTLGPAKYEPWMGDEENQDTESHPGRKRRYVMKLRAEWLKTEEGNAFTQKKEAKKATQREIMAKIRAIKKAKGMAKEGATVPAGDAPAEA